MKIRQLFQKLARIPYKTPPLFSAFSIRRNDHHHIIYRVNKRKEGMNGTCAKVSGTYFKVKQL
ncbi:hypothetical protein [Gracilibacillus phocaeensis]|uniref:hypothetical protein n=1 Tax=Gracilibacillus phocaeensis TaxID=2042304 RepID=UPI000AB0A7F2|nr:hypothetical protein [Gracilibacillus phocaeensis]